MSYIQACTPSGVSIGGSSQLMLEPTPAGTSCASSTTCLIKKKSGRPKAPNPLDDPSIPLKKARRIMANRESADRSKQRAKIARVQARQRLAELKSQLTDVQQQLQAMQDSMDVLELVQCAVTGVPAPAATANSLKQQLRHGGIVPPRPSRKRSRSSTQQSPHVMLQPQSEQQHVGHFGRTQAHVQPAAAPSGAHVQQPCRPVAHDSVAHTHPLHAGASTPAAGAVPPVCSARNVQEAVPIKELSPTAASKPAVLPPPQTSAAAHTAGSADRPLVPATCTQQLQQVLPPLISLLQALQQYAEHTGVTAP